MHGITYCQPTIQTFYSRYMETALDILIIGSFIIAILGWGWIVSLAWGNAVWKGLACVIPLLNIIYGIRHFNDAPKKNTRIAILMESQFLILAIIASFNLGNGIAPKDQIDNKWEHFAKSIEFVNQATRILNSGEPYSTVTYDDQQKMLELYKSALEEAEKVDIKSLNISLDGLGEHYQKEFIQGLHLHVEGLEVNDQSKLFEGQLLFEKWGDFYAANYNKISD